MGNFVSTQEVNPLEKEWGEAIKRAHQAGRATQEWQVFLGKVEDERGERE